MRFLLRLPVVALTALLAFSSVGFGQSLEEKLQAKLGKAFVKNAQWVLDFDEAQAAAKKANKPIFAYFTRSYQP